MKRIPLTFLLFFFFFFYIFSIVKFGVLTINHSRWNKLGGAHSPSLLPKKEEKKKDFKTANKINALN